MHAILSHSSLRGFGHPCHPLGMQLSLAQCFPQAMGAMNRQMNMPALQKIMRDFEMQNERMEMTSDVMGDAIDDAFEVGAFHCRPSRFLLYASVHMHAWR